MFNVKLKLEARHQAAILGFNNSPFTPDVSRLEKYRHQLLFLTDEWMRDRRQNMVVEEDSSHECVAFTKDKFKFLVKSTDGTPVAIPDPEGHRIKGELISIPQSKLSLWLKLDKLKLNGLQFIRTRTTVINPYRLELKGVDVDESGNPLPRALQGKGVRVFRGAEQLAEIDCWMYIGAEEYWLDMIYEQPWLFNQVPVFKPKKEKAWLEPYYKYQNP